MPVIDFTTTEEKSFEPVPNGLYTARITGAEIKTGDKAPYLNLELTIADGGEFDGRKVWDILSFAPNALFKLMGCLRALGYDEAALRAPGGFSFEPDDIMTAPIGIKTKIEKSGDYDPKAVVRSYFAVDAD